MFWRFLLSFILDIISRKSHSVIILIIIITLIWHKNEWLNYQKNLESMSRWDTINCERYFVTIEID